MARGLAEEDLGSSRAAVLQVSARLMQLRDLLGGRDDVDIVHMVVREPRCGALLPRTLFTKPKPKPDHTTALPPCSPHPSPVKCTPPTQEPTCPAACLLFATLHETAPQRMSAEVLRNMTGNSQGIVSNQGRMLWPRHSSRTPSPDQRCTPCPVTPRRTKDTRNLVTSQ